MRGLLLVLLAACATPAPREATTYHFQEGASLVAEVDDEVTFRLEVRGGRLIVNGKDTGPYRAGAPVRFVSAGEMLVDGERRAIP